MAGSGRRVFTPGEVLSASNVMNYLQDQTVMNFAGTAARGSAIGTAVSEGMVSYLQDTNDIQVYDGANWNPLSQIQSQNFVINGAFDIWQRGTSVAHAGGGVGSDMWREYTDSGSGTQTKDTTDYPTGIVAQSYKFTASANSTNWSIFQILETANTLPLAGRTVTLSVYLKSNISRTIKLNWNYSTGVDTGWAGTWVGATAVSKTVTTSWAQYSTTFVVPSNAKTLQFGVGSNGNDLLNGATVNVAAVQLEVGSAITPFRRNTNSVASELAACQRYHFRFYNDNGSYATIAHGKADGTTSVICPLSFPVDMRAYPTAVEWSGSGGAYAVANTISSISIIRANKRMCSLYVGTTGLSTGTSYLFTFTTDSSAYIGISAEL